LGVLLSGFLSVFLCIVINFCLSKLNDDDDDDMTL